MEDSDTKGKVDLLDPGSGHIEIHTGPNQQNPSEDSVHASLVVEGFVQVAAWSKLAKEEVSD